MVQVLDHLVPYVSGGIDEFDLFAPALAKAEKLAPQSARQWRASEALHGVDMYVVIYSTIPRYAS